VSSWEKKVLIEGMACQLPSSLTSHALYVLQTSLIMGQSFNSKVSTVSVQLLKRKQHQNLQHILKVILIKFYQT
jgi:hypothetical protein